MPKETEEKFWESSENTKTVNQLIRQLKKPIGIVPFVGAGISIPYEYYGWTNFLLAFSEEYGLKDQIKKRIDLQEYEEAANDLENEVGSFALSNAIKESYGEYQPSLSKITAAHYIPFISHGPVITTNLDRVLENIFKEYNKEFLEVVWGAKSDLIRTAIGEGERFLLKVHGDALDKTDRILTLSEYHQHYGDLDSKNIDSLEPNKPLAYLLYKIMSSRRLFFIGCSLVSDRTMLILKYLANKPAALDHFAILPKPKTIKECREKVKIYGDTYRIRPIWLPLENGKGFDQLVDFLEYLIIESYPPGHSVIELINALETNNWDKCLNFVENKKISYPITGEIRYILLMEQGLKHLNNEELSIASKLFDSAIEINLHDPNPLFLKGLTYLAQEEWGTAIEQFDECIHIDPQYEDAKIFLGISLVCRNDDNSKDKETAVEIFNVSLEANPENALALFGKSVLLLVEGNFDEAHKYLDLAEKIDNTDEEFKLSSFISKNTEGKWWKRPLAYLTVNIIISLCRVFIRKLVLSYSKELGDTSLISGNMLQSSTEKKRLSSGKTNGNNIK